MVLRDIIKSTLKSRYNWLQLVGCSSATIGIINTFADVENESTSTFITIGIIGIALLIYGFFNMIWDIPSKFEDENKIK